MFANFVFIPQQTEQAQARVAQAHPTKLSLADKDSSHAESILGRVIKLLRQTPKQKEHLERLIRTLTNMERRYFGGILLLPDEPALTSAALECGTLDQRLIAGEQAWRAYCHHYRREQDVDLATFILTQRIDQCMPHQVALLRTMLSAQAPLKQLWDNAVIQKLPLSSYLERIQCVEGSRLAQALEESLLTAASAQARELHHPQDLAIILDGLAIPSKLSAFEQTHRLYSSLTPQQAVKHEHVLMVLRHYESNFIYKARLEIANAEAAKWFELLHTALQLADFFAKAPDNERFEFWQGYLPRMKDVHGDLQNLRLFIDFGGFGVVEFGEVGNATYFYERANFARLWAIGTAPNNNNHKDFKDVDRMLFKLNHITYWQSNFRLKLQNLFANYAY